MKGLWGWNPDRSPPASRLEINLEDNLEEDMSNRSRGHADETFSKDEMYLLLEEHVSNDAIEAAQKKVACFQERTLTSK